jgi:hypothetical protein
MSIEQQLFGARTIDQVKSELNTLTAGRRGGAGIWNSKAEAAADFLGRAIACTMALKNGWALTGSHSIMPDGSRGFAALYAAVGMIGTYGMPMGSLVAQGVLDIPQGRIRDQRIPSSGLSWFYVESETGEPVVR